MAAPPHELILGFFLLTKHLPTVIVEYDDPAGQHPIK